MKNDKLILNDDILTLNKKELVELGITKATELIDAGWADSITLMVQSKKYIELLASFNSTLKSSAADSLTQNGNKMEVLNSKVSLVNGATFYDYSQDTTYANLERQLFQRKELLKAALKMDEPIIDNDGAVVPKVGVLRHGADMVKITL